MPAAAPSERSGGSLRDPEGLPGDDSQIIGNGATGTPIDGDGHMTTIEVLGPGCYNCYLLEQAAREAVELAGVEAQVVKVTDYGRIAGYGVRHTPGLVIDGRVVSAGRIPAAADIAQWLTANRVQA